MADVIRTVTLRGFDPEVEPVIRVIADGSLELRFEFMPPSDALDGDELGGFADLDEQLDAAVGVPGMWEDREVFLIPALGPGTLETLRAFVEGYRKR